MKTRIEDEFELNEVYNAALMLFDDNQTKALHWFMTEKKALDFKSPYETCRTLEGCNEVRTFISRLERGVML